MLSSRFAPRQHFELVSGSTQSRQFEPPPTRDSFREAGDSGLDVAHPPEKSPCIWAYVLVVFIDCSSPAGNVARYARFSGSDCHTRTITISRVSLTETAEKTTCCPPVTRSRVDGCAHLHRTASICGGRHRG